MTNDPFNDRCASTITHTRSFPPIQCDELAYHDGPHHGHDLTSAYHWIVESYPTGWQTPIDDPDHSVIVNPPDVTKTP